MNDDFFDDDVYESPKPRRRARVSSREDSNHFNSVDRDIPPVRERSRKKAKEVDLPSLEALGDINQILKLASLLVVFIITAICGIAFLKVSAAIVVLVLILVVVMGFMLHETPKYVSVFLAAAILLVGMITGMADICMCADVVYLSSIMISEKK